MKNNKTIKKQVKLYIELSNNNFLEYIAKTNNKNKSYIINLLLDRYKKQYFLNSML